MAKNTAASEMIHTFKELLNHAEKLWSVAQDYLAPYDDTVIHWILPWLRDMPPLADGVPTLMAIPPIVVGLATVLTFFDMCGKLAQWLLFRQSSCHPWHPIFYQASDALRADLPNFAILPHQPLADVVQLHYGVLRQRARLWRRLIAERADAVICHPESMKPLGVVVWQPRGRENRQERSRQHRIRRLCKKARLQVWLVEVRQGGRIALPEGMTLYLRGAYAATPSVYKKEAEPASETKAGNEQRTRPGGINTDIDASTNAHRQ